jgi:hypothetical protein
MKKGYTAALALVFISIFIFAACEKKSRYGVLITDEIGMTHVLATDSDGATIQDGNGNLVEVVTDSDSKKPIPLPNAQSGTEGEKDGEKQKRAKEYQTQSITFPAFIENRDSVEVAAYVMPKPKGWEMTGSASIILKDTGTETIIDTYEGGYATVQEGREAIDEQRVKLEKDIPFSYEEDYKICGTSGIKCHYDLGDTQRYLYLVMVNDTVYRFGVTIKTEHDGKVDYEGILNGIKFR